MFDYDFKSIECLSFKDLEEIMVFAVDKHGNDVFIDDAKNGRSCELFCKYCGNKMIAKNSGNVLKHHFAHENGSNCKKGHETQILLLFKWMLEFRHNLCLPSGSVVFKGKNLVPELTINFSNKQLVYFDEINSYFLKGNINGEEKCELVVDISIRDNQQKLDFLKTNESFVNVLEIDLSKYRGTTESVFSVLAKTIKWHENTKWIKLRLESKYIAKFKELGTWYFFPGTNHLAYCPRSKTKYISIQRNDDKCSSCPYSLMSILTNENAYYFRNRQCIGYIDESLTLNDILSVEKIDFTDVEKPEIPTIFKATNYVSEKKGVFDLQREYLGKVIKAKNLYNNRISYFYFKSDKTIWVRKILMNGQLSDKSQFNIQDDVFPDWEVCEEVNKDTVF